MGRNLQSIKMFSLLLISLTISMAVGQTPPHPTDDGIACEECIHEMHRFGDIIHSNADVLADYLGVNYCPTIEEEEQEGCPGHLAQHYPDMLGAVVHRLVTIIVTVIMGLTVLM